MQNEKLIRRFFFGEMSEEERFDLEERFIRDTDLFDEIKVVEDELTEKYVRGWMDAAERSKFETHFLSTVARRQRVELSRQLLNRIDEERTASADAKKTAVAAVDVSVWDRFAAILFVPKFAALGAFALIFAMIGGWVLYQNSNRPQPEIVRNNDIEKAEPTPAASTPEPTASPASSDSPAPDANNDIETITPSPTPIKTPVNVTPPNPVLALFAGTVRSEGKNKVLNLQKGAKAAILQLNLESVDYKTYAGVLVDADGNILFQAKNLKANSSKISLNIPADKLRRGDYIIKLSGKNDSGENESVADFQFRVVQ
ncbi:MAG: hypothetical protein WBO10_10110 [Pyrinomonadaceae bacterium]